MIFEFFKKLFWKADEHSRKRKINDTILHTEEDITRPKKHCHDFVSSNHVKIINDMNDYSSSRCIKTNSNSNSCLSLNLEQTENNTTNMKIEINSADIQQSSVIKSSVSNENDAPISKKNYTNLQKCKLINHSTLHETHKITEKKQYSEMLLNFVPFEHKLSSISNKITNIEQSTKIIDINKSKCPLINGNHDYSIKINKRQLSEPKFLMTTPSLKTVYQNKIFDINLENEDRKVDKSMKSLNRCTPIEIIKTNSLRDKFSTKDVIKYDFISEITKKYNQRMEQYYKEADELKKMTYILSKHNQLTREAALESQLNRSMRLCEAVLDERDSLVESKLPKLTTGMMERVKIALSTGSADEILVQEFGLRITRKDIQTLAGLNWLNDEIINFYMNLLIKRGNKENYPTVYAMNTFFYPKLISGGHASLKRWTRKVDIFAKDIIVVPIHLGMHWCMSIIDFRNKSIHYYDSMGSPNYKCLQVLKQYLCDESIDKKKKSFEFQKWNFECLKNIPQQMNGSDCGVFSCMFAEYICANRTLNFSQEDMPYFRNKMIYEILSVELL